MVENKRTERFETALRGLMAENADIKSLWDFIYAVRGAFSQGGYYSLTGREMDEIVNRVYAEIAFENSLEALKDMR